MKRIALLIFSVLIVFFAIQSAQAALIASWSMSGEPGSQLFTSGTGTADAAALDMVRGPDLTGFAGMDSLNSKGWSNADAGDYLEFGFSVLNGSIIILDELWIGTRSSNTGPGTIGFYSSIDNYTAPFFTADQSGETFVYSIVDLSSLGPISGDFNVRLYEIGNLQADGAGSTSSAGTFRITDYNAPGVFSKVQFTGTVSAVPVPASIWLLGIGLLGTIGVNRKLRS